MTDLDTPLRPLSKFQQSIIALAMVSMGAGMSINFVVVAPLARKAGLSPMAVAGILTLSAAIFAAVIPWWGRMADKIGRKRVMVFSLFATGLTNMAFLFALDAALAGVITGITTFLALAFMRLWFGLLSPGLQPASMAAMTDATTPHNRAAGLGMIGAAMSIGSIIGPAGATLLAPFGALMPIWGSIVFSLAVGVLLGFVLPPTRKTPRDTNRPKPLAFSDKRVRPHWIFLFAYFVAVAMVQQTVAWFIEDRYAFDAIDPSTYSAALGFGDSATVLGFAFTPENAAVTFTGLAFAALAVAMVIVQFGYIAPKKPDPRRILPLGLALVGSGYLVANVFHPYWVLLLAFAIVGVGAGLTVPSANALGSLSVQREEQGGAAALMSAAPAAGFVFGPLIGAGLYELSPKLPYYVASAAMFAFALYAYRVTSKRPLEAGP